MGRNTWCFSVFPGVTKGTRWFGSSLESSMMRLSDCPTLRKNSLSPGRYWRPKVLDPSNPTSDCVLDLTGYRLQFFWPPKIEKTKTPIPKRSFSVHFSGHFLGKTKLFSFSKVPSILYFHPVHGFRRSVEGSKYPNLGWRKLWPGWHGNISRWLVHGGVAIPNYRLSTGFCCEYPFNCSW